MKRITQAFLLLVLLNSVIEAEESFGGIEASKEHVIDERENYFLTATDYKITPKVNPITGELFEEEIDLIVAGCQPLSVRRFYNSSAPKDERYASWRYNPEAFLAANFELGRQDFFAAIGEMDGSVYTLKPSQSLTNTFVFEKSKHSSFAGFDGASHPLNTKITYRKEWDPKNKNRFQFMGTVTDGSGRERTFLSCRHSWLNQVIWIEKKWNPNDLNFKTKHYVSPNVWTPYQIPIVEEKLPNGNVLCYEYTQWKDQAREYPYPDLLASITAYNADKSQVLGSIHFNYIRGKHKRVDGVAVTGSDARVSFMQHQKKEHLPIRLVSAKRAGQPFVKYNYDDEKLNGLHKPDGRAIISLYDTKGKVKAQYAPVGPHGENCPIGRYKYYDQLTVYYDAENNKTHYRYDDDKKLTAIETFQGNDLYRVDRFEWDSSTGNLTRKTIEDGLRNPIHITEFQYDKNQNPILERVGDGKEWRTITRTYSDDGFNLKLTETDREGKLIRNIYVPKTNLVAAELIYENNSVKKRIFHDYDNCAICIKTIVDDGVSEDPENLLGVTHRTITYTTPKRTLPCYGLPEIVEEKTIDAKGHEIPLKKTIYSYTPFGKILQEEHYDANNNLHHTVHNDKATIFL